jgi:hypothetical protein
MFGSSILDYSQLPHLSIGAGGSKVNTAAAAQMLGVSKVTLLRWFRQKKIAEVSRDRHGWRVFSAGDISRIKRSMDLA